MKYLNKYIFIARYIPALITMAPVSLLYFCLIEAYSDFTLPEYLVSVPFVAGVSGTFILTFFVSMITRELGTFLERKYFKRKDGFPSTYLMLYNNDYLPSQVKDQYGIKIKADFDLTRLNREQEANARRDALQLLSHASRLVSTKYQQHDQVKEANINYGFSRNLSGGLFISIPAALAGIAVGFILSIHVLVFWSSFIAGILLLVAIFHKKWITSNSEKYAEKLFSVYLGEKGISM